MKTTKKAFVFTDETTEKEEDIIAEIRFYHKTSTSNDADTELKRLKKAYPRLYKIYFMDIIKKEEIIKKEAEKAEKKNPKPKV